MDRLFDAQRCARRRLRQYGPGGSLQPFVQSGQAKTTSRCGRVEDRSANRRRSHRVHPQYGNFLGWHPAAALFRLPRRRPSNYGSAGAGVAHEISHTFDELGNIYDAQGRLGMWRTPADVAKYHAAVAKLVAQFDSYCPLPDLCVHGTQVLSENIGGKSQPIRIRRENTEATRCAM